jgi:hypothetical protein
MGVHRGQQRDKPFRDALRIEIADAGDDRKALRAIARALIMNAQNGDNIAIREVADRLDGKVPQAIVGDDDEDPIRVAEITDEQRSRAVAVLMAKNAATNK